MNAIARGFWSGVMATSPMTVAMFGMQQRLPLREKSPLPPATLSSEIMDEAGVARRLTTEQRQNVSLVAHFAYGAACGILYAWLSPKVRVSPVIKGGAYASAVWASGYLGWTRIFDLRPSAERTPLRRNAMMIAAHFIWGATLAWTENYLQRNDEEALDGLRKASGAE